MLDLLGKAIFTAEQISAMRSALDQYGLPMPQFRRIGGKSLFSKYVLKPMNFISSVILKKKIIYRKRVSITRG